MEAAHCGFQVAIRLNLLAIYSLLIALATAENVEDRGVKCTGSRSTGKVSSKYRSKSWGHNYDEASGGNNFAHKVDAEMPI